MSTQSPAPSANQPTSGPVTVLQLPPKSGSACQPTSGEQFGPPRVPCSPVFDDIIYAPSEDPASNTNDDKSAFWLLPAAAANAIRQKSRELSALISPDKPLEERQKGLDDSGLLEYFLDPRLSQFLVGEQKARMERFEEKEPRLLETFKSEYAALFTDPRNQAFSHYTQRRAELEEWDQLRKLAIFKAQSQGYTYRDGLFFTAEAEAARKAVQAYNEARAKVISQYGTLAKALGQMGEVLREFKTRYEEATQCIGEYRECRGELIGVLLWMDDRKSLFNYIGLISQVANYGLAVPEFALIDTQGEVASGIARFHQYITTLDAQRKVESELRSKYQRWVAASAQNVPPPAGLLDQEREQWDQLQVRMDELHQAAIEQVARDKVRRHLLWNPESFAPKPLDRLVKTDFPLREVSWPFSLETPMHHISLDMLKGLKKLPGNSNGRAAKDHATSDFHDWLIENGALRIPAQGDWFDKEGWFDGDAFHRYLQAQHYQVKTLSTAKAREDWNKQLRQMLFKKDAQQGLRLFDNSPSAALVRLLTPPQKDLQTGAVVKKALFSLSGEVSLDINLARGEVEIFKFDLPERSQARELPVPYRLDGDPTPRSMNIGKFSLHLSMRAWGFAGASALLSGALKVGVGNAGYGASLDPIQPATRTPGTANVAVNASSKPMTTGRGSKVKIEDGAKAGFNLFAGVQAGILATGALNWAPPKTLVSLKQIPAMPGQATPDSEWLSVARLEGGLGAAIGVGLKGEIGLSVSKGCLILRLKAAVIAGPGIQGSLSFSVGYEAITDLLNLVRRELHNNQQKRMEWVTDDAMQLLARLNLAGALGINVGMLYLLNHGNEQLDTGLRIADAVMSLYEAITSGGKGGPIAHAILNYENQDELRRWVVECIPEGLGPLLMTLLSTPKSFEVTEQITTPQGTRERKESFTREQSHLFQQQAIERVLKWIVDNAGGTPNGLIDAQKQFDQACSRMNRFGSYESKGQTYCDNRFEMDGFMKDIPNTQGSTSSANNDMRARYMEHTKTLGALRDGYCRITNYYGVTYLPGGRSIYTGPGI